jgi:group I intron endonuclease
MIIYKITNKVNGNFYIGKTTKTADERFKRHFYNHKKQNTYLYKAMRKYGFDEFQIEILEETINLNEREIYWIKKLSPVYNMTLGGDGGDTSNSPNFIKGLKRRPSPKPTYGMLGKKQSQNFKNSIQKSNRCPVICEGNEYSSVGEAQLAYPGISIRKRLDNSKYPNFYRLREKTLRKST